MNILLFGGTTEGRLLSEKLLGRGHAVTVCVATGYGEEEQAQVNGATVLTGRKDATEMADLMAGRDLCVDATHPYATEATKSIRSAAAQTGTRYVRVKRDLSEDETTDEDGVRFFETSADAAAYLQTTDGNILLATGVKELPDFAGLPPERLFPRILPTVENLQACEALGIPHRNIIAMQGPFTKELNAALLRQKQIARFVTKDGGTTGGFPEKREAALEAGVELLVLTPPDDEGVSIETLLKTL